MTESPKFLNGENKYEGAVEGEDSLIPQETTVIETQFNEDQLREIFVLMEIYQQNMDKFGISDSLSKIESFLDELVNLYGIDTVKTCALYYILKGEDIPENVDRLDLSEDNFKNFITQGFSLRENFS